MFRNKGKFLYVIIYYIFLTLVFIKLIDVAINFPIILNCSFILFLLTIIVIPVLFVILPIFLIKKRKKDFSDSFIVSFILIILYILSLWYFSAYLIKCSIKFTDKNWKKHFELRESMITELENKYGLVGMKKDEIIDLLGKPYETDKGICYYIGIVSRNKYYCCLAYDEKDTITNIGYSFEKYIKFYDENN